MTQRFTVISTNPELKEDPTGEMVKAAMYTDLAPVLGLKQDSLRKAYEKLSASLKEGPLLERLTSHVGNETLAWLPDMAAFPDKNKVRDLFFEDESRTEYSFDQFSDIDDEELGAEGFDLVNPEAQAVILAKEKIRFPKMVIFFWHLARKQGTERAQKLLCQTLYTLAVYELLITRGLSKRQVLQDPLVQALPKKFQDLLSGFHVESQKKAPDVLGKLREGVKAQVRETGDERGAAELLHTLMDVHARSNRVLADQRTEVKELYYFAGTLLHPENFERLAAKILAACPQTKLAK